MLREALLNMLEDLNEDFKMSVPSKLHVDLLPKTRLHAAVRRVTTANESDTFAYSETKVDREKSSVKLRGSRIHLSPADRREKSSVHSRRHITARIINSGQGPDHVSL
jgi:hypothetical protein